MSLTIPPDVRARMAPAAAAMEPYDPCFTPVAVNLSANENSFGLPANVAALVAEALSNTPTNRYPLPLSDSLRSSLAHALDVPSECIMVGNGGDELLFNLFLAFGGEGRTLINCPPTFSVYRSYAELVGTTVVDVPRTSEYALNTQELIAAATATSAALVVLTSPNNPTGNVIDISTIDTICNSCTGIVLVDQAYVEFANPSANICSLLSRHSNLVILRTFSKAYALAGLRVGYVVASPGVIAALATVRQPYSVNVVAQAAAEVVLAHREACIPTIEHIVAEREALFTALGSLCESGVTVFPSEANFLLVQVPNAHRVWQRLRDEYSVLVRDFSHTEGLENCLRITVGTPEENKRLVGGLRSILG